MCCVCVCVCVCVSVCAVCARVCAHCVRTSEVALCDFFGLQGRPFVWQPLVFFFVGGGFVLGPKPLAVVCLLSKLTQNFFQHVMPKRLAVAGAAAPV